VKIDVFAHILPSKYKEAISQKVLPAVYRPYQATHEGFPSLVDLEARFKVMDEHKGLVQVLTLTVPFV